VKERIEDKIKYYREWKKYKETGDKKSRNFLVVRYLPLAKYVAGTIPSSTPLYTYEDLISWACIGLIDAIDKFDPDKGIKFETYAISRIKGEILDNLRKLTTTHFQKQKKVIEKTYDKLFLNLGRPPSEFEMAEELKMDMKKYRKMLSQILPVYVLSLDNLLEINSSIVKKLMRRKSKDLREIEEKKEMISKALEKLSEMERKVITLYYYEGLTMKEISEILNISEGRVSQLHASALLRMKKEIGGRKQ